MIESGINSGIVSGILRGINPHLGLPAPTVTITVAPSDPSDDPTPTFEWTCSEVGCTYQYRIDGGAWTTAVTPLTLGAMADDTYLFEVRATDPQGNTGAADSHTWTLATAYAGTLPSTVAALNGWSLASPWTVLHNFTSATIGPSACSASTGSETLNLTKWGDGSGATLESVGQSGYAAQGGYTVNSGLDYIIATNSSLWKFSATVPTAYLLTFKFGGTPSNGQVFYVAWDGANGGCWLEAHSTSGIRAMVGSGSGAVFTSYVGGTSFYDGEYHTIMLVIDDAAGKAKIYSEFANTESTGLTIATTNCVYAIGPWDKNAAMNSSVTYLLSARGEHPLLYTNAQSLFDEYEDARLNNVNQTAIAGLPTTLAALNDATGLTFTDGWNVNSTSSNAALTGASTATLVPDTGTMPSPGSGTGTAPTAAAAPQVRTSFTSQAAVTMDSDEDNLGIASAFPTNDFTMLLVVGSGSYTSGQNIASCEGGTGTSGWAIISDASSSRLNTYASYGASYQALLSGYSIAGGSKWRVVLARVAPEGATSRIIAIGTGESSYAAGTSAAIPAIGSPTTNKGHLGSGVNNAAIGTKHAFCAWLSGQTTDANMTAAANAFRWRYGL